MSVANDPISFLIRGASQLIKVLTGDAQDLEDKDAFLAPFLGFAGEIEGLDTNAVMRDIGSRLSDITEGGVIPALAGLTLTDIEDIDDEGEFGGLPVRPFRPRRIVRSAPPTRTDTEGKVRYATPEEAKKDKDAVASSDTSSDETVTKRPVRLADSKSMLLIDEEVLQATMDRIGATHTIVTLTISALSMVAEIATLGQLDALLECVQSVYTIFDEPAAFYKTRDSRIEIVYDRPYRYWLESEMTNAIPPPADLTRFLAREVISEEEYDESMKYWGFATYYSDLYRRARYIELPAQTIYELLHRGIIDDAEAARLLKIADYNPVQIPNLVELSYDYPNRTELRVMARRTDIPAELVTRALQTSGLRPEYQEYLVEMLDNWEVASIQTRTISEARRQYEDGLIDEERLVEICRENRASDAEIIAYGDEAILRRDGRRKTERTATIRRAYRSALLSETHEYLDIVKTYFPDLAEADITEIEIYQSLMFELGYDEIDIEIMLDDDKIRSKDATVIESLGELLDEALSK